MDRGFDLELRQLITALLLGLGTGIFYDFLKPLRYKGGRAAAVPADILFCLVGGGAVFIYFMHKRSAAAGIWQLLLIPAGFIIYQNSLTKLFLPIIVCSLEFFIKFYAKSEKIIKKLLNSAKNIFQNMR